MEDLGKQTNVNEVMDIPGRSRKCTDILFLVVIFSAWLTMLGIGGAALGYIESSSEHIPKGDPRRLTHGMDYEGNICGVTNATTSATAITRYDHRHTQSLKEVKGESLNFLDLPYAYYLPSGLPVCVPSCPSENNFSAFYCTYDVQNEVNQASNDVIGWKYVSEKVCMPLVKSRSLLGYCYPLYDVSNNGTISDVINDTEKNNMTIAFDGFQTKLFFEESLADLTTSRDVILGFGLGFSTLLGFLFLLLLRTPGILHLVVWSFVAVVLAGLSGSAYYMNQTGKRWENEDIREDHEVTGILGLGYVLACLAVLWLVTICCMRKRIVLAIECIKEASMAIGKMPLLIFYPVSQALCMLIFLLVWCIITIHLAASGTMVPSCLCPSTDGLVGIFVKDKGLIEGHNEAITCDEGCFLFKSFEYATNTKYAGLYMIFIWFWTSQFILAVGEIIIALSVSTYYFTRDKSEIGNRTFLKSMRLTTYFHLGTAAFGSLIIAVVQTIRTVIVYIEKCAVKRKESSIAKIILKTIHCCLWVVEKFMKFVNKNAYIQTAIMGYSFCKAAQMSFTLLLKNVFRVAAVSIVSEFILFIGKVFIVVVTTSCGYIYLDKNMSDVLNGLWLPTVLVALISFCISQMFSEIFGMTISTILQCFITDEELLEPNERFARESLAKTIDNTQSVKGITAIHPKM